MLNKDFQIIDKMQGELTRGNITIDANSNIRRVVDFNFFIKDRTYFTDKSSKIWVDKYVDVSIGICYRKTREILWYPLGTYIFNENGFNYDSVTRMVTCSCVDLMGYFTGLRAGVLRGLKTIIPHGSIITDVVRDTITQLGNIHNYIIEANDNVEYHKIPYDLEFGAGTTVYEILDKIANLYPATEFYFNTNKTFYWGYTPTTSNDIVILDDSIFSSLVIEESTGSRFSDIKNCIEVWGQDDISARILLVDKVPDDPNPDYNYKVNPDSPFTVDKIGEIWDVKSSGEYAKIYSKELALDRAKHELFLATSSQDNLSLTTVLIPFLDVSKKISYRSKTTKVIHPFVTKKIMLDITSSTMKMDCVRFNPLYSWL